MIITPVLMIVMKIVQVIRKDPFTYLSAPEDLLSPVIADRIMKFGHALPCIIAAFYLALSVVPAFSDSYAAKLERNEWIVPATIIGCLLPLLITTGFLVEMYVEQTKPRYREEKALRSEKKTSR